MFVEGLPPHITGFLRRLAAERPLVLVFDDLHAADVPSLRWLAFLARWVVDSRILVVCTCRETETVLDRRHPLRPVVERGAGGPTG